MYTNAQGDVADLYNEVETQDFAQSLIHSHLSPTSMTDRICKPTFISVAHAHERQAARHLRELIQLRQNIGMTDAYGLDEQLPCHLYVCDIDTSRGLRSIDARWSTL